GRGGRDGREDSDEQDRGEEATHACFNEPERWVLRYQARSAQDRHDLDVDDLAITAPLDLEVRDGAVAPRLGGDGEPPDVVRHMGPRLIVAGLEKPHDAARVVGPQLG